MEPGGLTVSSIFKVIVVIVVALALLPVVISSVADAAASLTGAAATLVNLIPLFYVIAVVLMTVYWAVGKYKGG